MSIIVIKNVFVFTFEVKCKHYTCIGTLQRYFVASHRSSQALVIIEHENTYNLYLSDETGVYYSLSLENLAVKATSSVDLIVVSNC